MKLENQSIESNIQDKIDSPQIMIDEIVSLGTRVKNAMKRIGVSTLDEMIEFFSDNSIESVKNLGSKSKQEISDLLEKYNHKEYIETINNNSCVDIEFVSENYPFINMNIANELLPICAMELFGFSKSVQNAILKKGISTFGDLRAKSINFIASFVKKLNTEQVLYLAKVLEKSDIEVFEEFINCNHSSTEYQIVFRRATGETLQEIALHPSNSSEDKLTRERVRQLQEKFFVKAKLFVDVLVQNHLTNQNYITIKLLEDKFGTKESMMILQYVLKKSDEYEFLDFADILVKKENPSVEQRLIDITKEFIGDDGLDLYDNLENFEQIMIRNKLEFIEIDSYINFLKKHHYVFYKDFAVKGKLSYAMLCAKVVSKYFDGSIKTTQDDTEKSEDLDRLRELVYHDYGDIGLPESNRALCSRLSTCMVLSGRGQLIPKEKIYLDEDVLMDIKKWIDDFPSDKIFYSEIFGEFEGLLKSTSNIDNYNFLHGVIALYFGDDYNISSRDCLVKNNTGNYEYSTLTDRIENVILNLGRPAHKKEIKAKFVGMPDVVLFNPIPNSKNLIQWEFNYYSSMNLLEINEHDTAKLNSILDKILISNDGYCSDAMFYAQVELELKEFLDKNNIKTDINLYYIMEKLFKTKYDFRRPHITIKGKFENISVKDVALSFIGDKYKINYDEYIQLSQKMMWSPITSSMVFSHIEEDYIRINKDDYVRKDLFDISKEKLDSISECIHSCLVNGMFAIQLLYKHKEFPDIGHEWNEFLLGSLCESFLKEYKIIYPLSKDRRRQNGVIVARNSSFKTYSDLVANLMIYTDNLVLSEKQMLSLLVLHGMAKKVVPKELRSSRLIKYSNEMYELV